jgi:hypothetical protein
MIHVARPNVALDCPAAGQAAVAPHGRPAAPKFRRERLRALPVAIFCPPAGRGRAAPRRIAIARGGPNFLPRRPDRLEPIYARFVFEAKRGRQDGLYRKAYSSGGGCARDERVHGARGGDAVRLVAVRSPGALNGRNKVIRQRTFWPVVQDIVDDNPEAPATERPDSAPRRITAVESSRVLQ